jgi:hypothetical protein
LVSLSLLNLKVCLYNSLCLLSFILFYRKTKYFVVGLLFSSRDLNPKHHFHVASTFQITDMSSVQHMLVSETDTTLTHMVTFNCIHLKLLPVYYVNSQGLNPRRLFHVKSTLQIVCVSSVQHMSVSKLARHTYGYTRLLSFS